MGIIIYHNPRCSKSRQTLSLIREQGHTSKIIEYLKEPPSVSEILNILSLLNVEPRAILRTKEGLYKELKLSNSELTVDQLVEAIANNPILMERPIVINGNKATIGRPPEKVLPIL
ncbi:MAG: arsenate reductase (glutaredoxin) [Rhodospirillaceae bacterium]|nr:arsenate reductase (glutaredoxin) [Rhodospirillaceae bacterium]